MLQQEITVRQKQEITERQSKQGLFTITIIAASERGEPMNEQRFLIDLIFKPKEPDFKLHPEEIQLLLSHIGEILKELEVEEQRQANDSGDK